jgi:xanthine/CO dehydrogenase XdhC/CoxF family maturation factor
MKHWNETEEILARVAELLSLGRSGALATVVGIRGSAYRRPGAKFLIEDDGRTVGGVSGGCLEADVREIAREVMRTGTPRLRHYETGSDDRVVWGLGLGCNGSVDVFIQPVGAFSGDTLSALRERLRGDHVFAVAIVVEGPDTGRSLIFPPLDRHGDGARDAAAPVASQPASRDTAKALRTAASARLDLCESGLDRAVDRAIFTDVLVPPPHLVICGAGDDARPVAACAAEAGFQVTVVDHRPAYLTSERFPAARRLLQMRPEECGGTFPLGPGTSVVLMTHSLALDREWLRRLLATGATYIGVLGPRARSEEILHQLGAEDDDRVFGPVGLDIGADGPEQIAISIVAELLAERARREPRHLRARGTPIHANGS